MVEVRPTVKPSVELHEGLEVLARAERRVCVAIHANELRRHALVDLGLVTWLGEDPEPGMAVQVDEPRAYDLARCVNGGLHARRSTARVANDLDATVDHDDIGHEAVRSRAVHHRRAVDQQVRGISHSEVLRAAGREPRRLEPCWGVSGR